MDLIDQLVLHLTGGWLIVAEDGVKLLGALAWVAVPVSAYVHAGVVAGPPAPAPEAAPVPDAAVR